MIIEKIHIDSFRKLKNIDIPLGNKVTVIAGQNGTMKTTLLGMISQPFSMRTAEGKIKEAKTIDGYAFESKFKEKFKISSKHDVIGSHLWRLYIPDNEIYSKEYIELTSIKRGDKKNDKENELRFWSTEGKSKGMSYVTCPVIYLSLKRIIPIGEENITLSNYELSDEEIELYKRYHNEILCLREEIINVSGINSVNKRSLGPETTKYDSTTISAGQDNIGKILLAILSFKRLKDKYGDEYKGGLLLIDELDATLFPAAQTKIVKLFYKFAKDLKLQIIFTTHSLDVIKISLDAQYNYNNDTKVIYLTNRDDEIVSYINPEYSDIIADLNLIVNNENGQLNKIRLYTEDDEAKKIAKCLMGNKYTKYVDFMDVSLGCENYKELIRKKVPEFTNNIIILDGDAKKVNSIENVVKLPGDKSPEAIFYSYLSDLSDSDKFWDDGLGGYTKQICFKDYTSVPDNREKYKAWFKSQEKHWGRNCSKLVQRWKEDNKETVEVFINNFINTYNILCEKNGNTPIST